MFFVENEEIRQKKYIKMTQTPIPTLICQLAVPTIISMLVTSFYNMADTFLWGRLTPVQLRQSGLFFP